MKDRLRRIKNNLVDFNMFEEVASLGVAILYIIVVLFAMITYTNQTGIWLSEDFVDGVIVSTYVVYFTSLFSITKFSKIYN